MNIHSDEMRLGNQSLGEKLALPSLALETQCNDECRHMTSTAEILSFFS